MKEYLDEQLKEYAKSGCYPFHMPGHKRQTLELGEPSQIDITEITGFDDLHAPEGILKEAMERAANLWGSQKSYFLVNGSTCGILAAISAVTKTGDEILVARNCHKSVYHAIELRLLKATYLYPQITKTGMQGAIASKEVLQHLEENPKIRAVVITSPTYDGIVSDVEQIAKICHAHEVPLIVDEAHGAHFGFHPFFPESAVKLGADLCVQSMHKTLPSLTQTALLHVQGNTQEVVQEHARGAVGEDIQGHAQGHACEGTQRNGQGTAQECEWGYARRAVDKNGINNSLMDQVEHFLGIYQTSSPSYVLMAGMDRCLRILKTDGERLFSLYVKRLQAFHKEMAKLSHLHVMTESDFTEEECFAFDASKLLISVKNTTLHGKELAEILRNSYNIETEMCTGSYVTAMTSIMDTDEGFARLAKALSEIDATLQDKPSEWDDFVKKIYTPKEKGMEISKAVEEEGVFLPFEEAAGHISKEYLYLYPPGIPLLVPGEIITQGLGEMINWILSGEYALKGLRELSSRRIEVVKRERLYYTKYRCGA